MVHVRRHHVHRQAERVAHSALEGTAGVVAGGGQRGSFRRVSAAVACSAAARLAGGSLARFGRKARSYRTCTCSSSMAMANPVFPPARPPFPPISGGASPFHTFPPFHPSPASARRPRCRCGSSDARTHQNPRPGNTRTNPAETQCEPPPAGPRGWMGVRGRVRAERQGGRGLHSWLIKKKWSSGAGRGRGGRRQGAWIVVVLPRISGTGAPTPTHPHPHAHTHTHTHTHTRPSHAPACPHLTAYGCVVLLCAVQLIADGAELQQAGEEWRGGRRGGEAGEEGRHAGGGGRTGWGGGTGGAGHRRGAGGHRGHTAGQSNRRQREVRVHRTAASRAARLAHSAETWRSLVCSAQCYHRTAPAPAPVSTTLAPDLERPFSRCSRPSPQPRPGVGSSLTDPPADLLTYSPTEQPPNRLTA